MATVFNKFGKPELHSIQLIEENGSFKTSKLEQFVKSVKLAKCGVSYAVVAIIGPQSSGKSTLLNHLFGTKFQMMEAKLGSKQTTQGIWMAKAKDVNPMTIVLDIEGSDGQERAEDKAFEKQSALFALAVADIVMVNITAKDIGLWNGSCKPLLSIVFQAMTKLSTPPKTTLLFVLRDLDEDVPFENSASKLREGLKQLWDDDELTNPKGKPLSEYFRVEVVGLPHYKYKRTEFEEKVAELKCRFQNSIAPGELAGNRQNTVEASVFSQNAKEMWERILENKDFDLPTQKVLLANFRCDQIAKEELDSFKKNEAWIALVKEVKLGTFPNFGETVASILIPHISNYDKEVEHFDEAVRNARRKALLKEMSMVVRPSFDYLLTRSLNEANELFGNLLEEALSEGKEFDVASRESMKACIIWFDKMITAAQIPVQGIDDWKTSMIKAKLKRDVMSLSASRRREKEMSDLIAKFKEQAKKEAQYAKDLQEKHAAEFAQFAKDLLAAQLVEAEQAAKAAEEKLAAQEAHAAEAKKAADDLQAALTKQSWESIIKDIIKFLGVAVGTVIDIFR